MLIFLAGCTEIGGLEIDDGRGNTVKWSMPDENCLQVGEYTNTKGVKVKTQRINDGCTPISQE